MSHNHHHKNHLHQDHHHSAGNIAVAFVLNSIFSVIELIGGLLTNSVAILADAVHDLGDSIALGLAWYFEKLSTRGRSHHFTFGYGRFSLLGAFFTTLILTAGSVMVLLKSIPRIAAPEPVNEPGMMLLAILGIVVNGAAVLWLKKDISQNSRASALHLLEDVLGWFAVLVAAMLIHFLGWTIMDPLLSVGVTLFILFQALKRLTAASRLFLQAVPDGIDIDLFLAEVANISGVTGVHDSHIWSLDGSHHFASLHLVLKDNIAAKDQISVKEKVRVLARTSGIGHITLELEFKDENCGLDDC